MSDQPPARPVALVAKVAATRAPAANVPAVFAAWLRGREKRPLGDPFGLTGFGVNLVRLPPGTLSALRHHHTHTDEFIYVLDGEPTLITEQGEAQLSAGMCAGFKAGSARTHHLVNRSGRDAVYLEVGQRGPVDRVIYPDDDVHAEIGPEGYYVYSRKDGTPF